MTVKRFKRVFLYFAVLLFTVFSLLPFYMMMMMGTYQNEELFTGIKLFPGNYLLQNLQTVLSVNYFQFYKNSLYIAVIAGIGGAFTSALAGFAFAKYRFRYKKTLFLIVIGTLMIPHQLGLIAFVAEMKWFGMFNTHWPLMIPPMANAFGVFWMTQFIGSSVPDEIIESCRVDGCHEFRIFLQIILPIIKPAITTIFLLLFLGSWNNYLTPLVLLNKENLYTVPLAISMLGNLYRVDYAARILALAIATVPMIILFIACSKSLLRGITEGSIKG